MKNVLLGVVFIFIGNIAIANSNAKQLDAGGEVDCIALAYAVDKEQGGISYEMFASIVRNCEAQKEK